MTLYDRFMLRVLLTLVVLALSGWLFMSVAGALVMAQLFT